MTGVTDIKRIKDAITAILEGDVVYPEEFEKKPDADVKKIPIKDVSKSVVVPIKRRPKLRIVKDEE